MSHNTPSPLVALLDWWGYRLMCYSMLPITAETLAYGSADGGNTGTRPRIYNVLYFIILLLLTLFVRALQCTVASRS
jgi:hypothetical protein